MHFLFAIKLSSDFFFTKFKYLQVMRKLYAKFIVPSVFFTRPSTILPVVKGNNMCKKGIKTYHFKNQIGNMQKVY